MYGRDTVKTPKPDLDGHSGVEFPAPSPCHDVAFPLNRSPQLRRTVCRTLQETCSSPVAQAAVGPPAEGRQAFGAAMKDVAKVYHRPPARPDANGGRRRWGRRGTHRGRPATATARPGSPA